MMYRIFMSVLVVAVIAALFLVVSGVTPPSSSGVQSPNPDDQALKSLNLN